MIIRKSVQKNCESLKKMSQDKQEETCAICLDEMKIIDQASIECCSHKFCFKCIKKWGTENINKCPLCKQKFNQIKFKNESQEEQILQVEDINQDEDEFVHDMFCQECDELILQEQEFEICETCEDGFLHIGNCKNQFMMVNGSQMVCIVCEIMARAMEDPMFRQIFNGFIIFEQIE